MDNISKSSLLPLLMWSTEVQDKLLHLLYFTESVSDFVLKFMFLAHPSRRLGGAYRIGNGPVWSTVVVCQYFQTTSPLKPLGHLNPNFIYGIYFSKTVAAYYLKVGRCI